MNIPGLIYYIFGGCVIILVLAVVSNISVNVLIKQFTERALHHFQHRLAQETAKALEAFRSGVCEQMAVQERKSDSLAKLYAALIDLLRDGKGFVTSIDKGEPLLTEKTLLTVKSSSSSFCEQYRKQSLHFSDDFKAIMDGFIGEAEGIMDFFETHRRSNSRDSIERKKDNDQIRQTWTAFEDRISFIMEVARNEFRSRMQTPENVMKKWFNEAPVKPATAAMPATAVKPTLPAKPATAAKPRP
jgi:hypothetical protein